MVAGRVETKYWVGSGSSTGHSIRHHSSGQRPRQAGQGVGDHEGQNLHADDRHVGGPAGKFIVT
jgi:hypothetical protein